MSRPIHHLYPPVMNAKAHQASTLMWIRDPGHENQHEESGDAHAEHAHPDQKKRFEVLLTKRAMDASFAPGAYVFPGGKIDEKDQAHASLYLRSHPQCALSLTQATQACTALRESFEELGLVLLKDHQGRPVEPSAQQALVRSKDLFEQLESFQWQLDLERLHLLCHWITDRDLPIRFDVSFWVAVCPQELHPVADEQEQFDPLWLTPQEALRQYHADQLHMVYPTIKTLERLVNTESALALMQATQDHEPWFSSCARAGYLGGKKLRYMEHESPFGELALVCPEGQVEHHLDWQSARAVALLKNVHRLTCPNPSIMTGPGTNTYLVGTPESGYIVIDPGPALPEHLERLFHFTQGDIRSIICTHSHADHSPGAKPLQAMCQGRDVPIWGLPSAPTAKANSQFVPDFTCQDQQVFVLKNKSNSLEHSLRAIHTPGHAANHLCLVLQEEGLLFSGDHILNGSTTVVDPPDGNMNAYMKSLELLKTICIEDKIEFILPAHGYVLGNAWGAPFDAIDQINRLMKHRLRREAKIKSVILKDPQGDLSSWVKEAYDDVPERVWPAAKRSLSAHVERLIEIGLGFELSASAKEQMKQTIALNLDH